MFEPHRFTGTIIAQSTPIHAIPRRGEPTADTTPGENRAIFAVGSQFFFNGAVVASFLPRLPEIRDRLEISIATLGLLLTVAAVSGIVGSACSSRVVDRFGTRTVIILGGGALAAFLSVVAVARSTTILLIALVALAATDATVDVAMNLQGSRLSARRQIPVVNRLHGMWSVGMLGGGTIAALSAGFGVSPKTHLLATSASLAVLVALIGRGLTDLEELSPPETTPAGSDPSIVVADAPRQTSSRNRPLLLFAILGLAAGAVEVTSIEWAAFRLADDFGASAGVAGLAFVAVTAGMAAGRLLGDWVQERVGADVLLQRTTWAGLAGLLLATLSPNQTLTIASFALVGLAIAPVFPRLYDDAAKKAGRAGSGLGALTAGIRVAALVAPAIVGAVAGSGLSVGAAMAFVTIPGIIGLVVLTRRHHPEGSQLQGER